MKFHLPFFNHPVETKTSVTIQDVDISQDDSTVYQTLLGRSDEAPTNIQPRQAYYYAERSSDLGGAVSRITRAISSFLPVISDSEGDVRYDDPLLEIINNPGEMRSRSKFLSEISESYLLTSECWIVARGNINRPPLAIVPIRPYGISIVFNLTDGMPEIIQTECEYDRRTYTRQIIGGQFRFIDAKQLNEIIPIIGQSNLTDGWRGRSPINKLYYDITMNSSGKRHNKSMLDNGLVPSMVVSPRGSGNSQGAPQQWNDKAVETLQKAFRAFHQGAGNARNALIVGKPAEVQLMAQNNVDMDFIELLKNSKEAIYNLYQIPLPLILSDAMTLSNYSIALRSFYVDAVFPVYDYIADGLLNALAVRYKSIRPGDTLTFSEIDIRGMRPVLVENMKQLKDTEAVQVNEIRSTGGFDTVEGGEVILIPAGKTTLEAITGGGNFSDSSNDEIMNGLTDDEEPTEEISIEPEAEA